MKYQAPRGIKDILPEETTKLKLLLDACRETFEYYNFKEIIIPIFEYTELFERSIGEGTDIVNKEMYTFKDKSDRSLTLRPEATAGILRAYIENGFTRKPKPVKLWTFGPMFRYERAQTGRYRQFYQIDIEAIGDSSVSPEVESMFMLSRIFEELKVDFRIEINSLGDNDSRKTYKEYFKKYTKGFLGDLCEDCKRRYEQNPLRMLDCKVKTDQEVYAGSKKPIEFLTEKSNKRWEEIKTLLGLYKNKNEQKIKNIVLNPSMVRGLDYYNDFVFEIISTNPVLKGQSTICGGGRYDDLIETLGGPLTPGYGFAIGVERVLLVLQETKKQTINISIISNQEEVYIIADSLNTELKNEKIKLNIEINYKPTNITKQIENALKKNIDFIIFYLDEEKKKNIFKIKNLKIREEKEISANVKNIVETLRWSVSTEK